MSKRELQRLIRLHKRGGDAHVLRGDAIPHWLLCWCDLADKIRSKAFARLDVRDNVDFAIWCRRVKRGRRR